MISRTITGVTIMVAALCFIFFVFMMGVHIDYASILTGVFFFIVGLFIALNKKEDEIEEIKK